MTRKMKMVLATILLHPSWKIPVEHYGLELIPAGSIVMTQFLKLLNIIDLALFLKIA